MTIIQSSEGRIHTRISLPECETYRVLTPDLHVSGLSKGMIVCDSQFSTVITVGTVECVLGEAEPRYKINGTFYHGLRWNRLEKLQ